MDFISFLNQTRYLPRFSISVSNAGFTTYVFVGAYYFLILKPFSFCTSGKQWSCNWHLIWSRIALLLFWFSQYYFLFYYKHYNNYYFIIFGLWPECICFEWLSIVLDLLKWLLNFCCLGLINRNKKYFNVTKLMKLAEVLNRI